VRVVPARDLVVNMELAEGQAIAPAMETKVVSLRGAGLDPTAVAITPRTKIRFRNEDPHVFDLQCAANPAMTGSAPLAPGRGIEFPFEAPGIYEITDRRMPHLMGYVVVVGTRFVANPAPTTDPPGGSSFSFADVPPGQYRVKVFHAGEWVAEQALEVAEAQEEVGVQIRLPAESQQHEGGESGTAEGASGTAEGER
jgi:plastocyanin